MRKYEIYDINIDETLMRVEADGYVEVGKTIEGNSVDCIVFINNLLAVGLLTFEKSPNYAVREAKE